MFSLIVSRYFISTLFSVLSLDNKDRIVMTPILGILVGIITALLLVTCLILGTMKVRSARRDGSQPMRGSGFLKEKIILPLRTEAVDIFEKDDKNPDVIPSNKGKLRCNIVY